MSKLILMAGVTAAGKTTYAKSHMRENDVYVSRDDIRFTLYDENNKFYASENIVFPAFIYEIVRNLKLGKTVWAEAVNDTPNFRHRILSEIEKYVIADSLEVIHIDTPVEIAVQRNIERGGPAKLEDRIVRAMHENLIPPTTEEFANRGYKEITITVVKN